MRMWLRLGAGVGVVGMLVAGCSSGPLPNATASEFCQSKATEECQVAALFCGQASPASCIATRQEVCAQDATQATSSGTRTYTQPNAAACISAVQSAYGGPSSQVSYATLQMLTATCEAVFAGSVAYGNSCKSDYDCATSGDICSGQAGSTETICAPPVNVLAEGFCSNPGDVCPTGYYCTGAIAKCQPSGMATTACTPPSVVCATGEYCQIDVGAKSGKCIQLATEGSACTMDSSCGVAAPYCDLFAPPSTGTSTDGSCELGLSFAPGSYDCKGFGAK
jgi:hypothetical protein